MMRTATGGRFSRDDTARRRRIGVRFSHRRRFEDIDVPASLVIAHFVVISVEFDPRKSIGRDDKGFRRRRRKTLDSAVGVTAAAGDDETQRLGNFRIVERKQEIGIRRIVVVAPGATLAEKSPAGGRQLTKQIKIRVRIRIEIE